MKEKWREILEDPEHGRAMRVLCRAIAESGITLGGAWSEYALVEEIIVSMQERDYEGAAALMAVLLADYDSREKS